MFILLFLLLAYPALAQVSFSAPPSAPAGSILRIQCHGQMDRDDYLTIVPEGKKDSWVSYRYFHSLRNGNPAKIDVPSRPGRYEIRYTSEITKRISSRSALVVTATSASLNTPDSAGFGETIEISWTGSNFEGDIITVVPEGAKEGSLSYTYLVWSKKGSPAKLRLPSEAGRYEIRYLTGSENVTVTSKIITIGDTSASISAPEQVQAGESFEVSWTGPNNPGDWVYMIHSDESKQDSRRAFQVLAQKGSPAVFKAPNTNGKYFLLYSADSFDNIIAERVIQVGGAQEVPGSLRVISSSSGTLSSAVGPSAKRAVEVILDCSGSMLQAHGSTNRMETAREALLDLIREKLPEDTPFALRAFGHTRPGSCETKLVVPFQKLDRASALSTVKVLQAKNLAKTPIASSLKAVSRDLQAAEGSRLVILLTDGEETCGGNPELEIKNLRTQGFDVQVNIVGFAIDEPALKKTFQNWARLGGGVYFDAQEASQIGTAFEKSLISTFEVLDKNRVVVAQGSVDGASLSLPAGRYRIRFSGGSGKEFSIEIRGKEEVVIEAE